MEKLIVIAALVLLAFIGYKVYQMGKLKKTTRKPGGGHGGNVEKDQ